MGNGAERIAEIERWSELHGSILSHNAAWLIAELRAALARIETLEIENKVDRETLAFNVARVTKAKPALAVARATIEQLCAMAEPIAAVGVKAAPSISLVKQTTRVNIGSLLELNSAVISAKAIASEGREGR